MKDEKSVVVLTKKDYRGEPAKVPGLRYEVCDTCGLEWNVSRLRQSYLPYRCPLCCYKKVRG